MNRRKWMGVLTVGLMAMGARAAQLEPDTQWVYKTVNGKELKMDVFLPVGYESGESFPVFVVYHGGSWRAGDTAMHYPDCEYWSRRGMIAVSVDYRLKDRDQVEVPLECVKDAKSAIRYLRKNAAKLKVNPRRIVGAGGSAGGQMAAAIAMIDGANDDVFDLSISCVPNAVILYNPYFKCQAELSPYNFVKANLPPFITFLGDEDPAIKVEDLDAFHKGLLAAGNDSEYYVGPGGKHGLCNGRNPRNPFFYWSLELEDAFLVKHGILTGKSLVKRPANVPAVVAVKVKRSAAVKVKASPIFIRQDKDHSGFVAEDEFVTDFMRLAISRDKNKDGLLTPTEFPFAAAFKSADLDKSGTLTIEEAKGIYQKQFKRKDANKDGVITPDEI